MSQSIVLMGVSGCGKSTVGKLLSTRLGWAFIEGDDIHPKENVRKMASGVPLNDQDRLPWLKKINAMLVEMRLDGTSVIVSCSALKQVYRQIIAQGVENLIFVYLAGDYDTIFERMQSRDLHYMKAEMLRSQFEALEPPGASEALVIPIDQPVEQIVARIVQKVRANKDRSESGEV